MPHPKATPCRGNKTTFPGLWNAAKHADIVIKNNYDSHLDEFVGDFLLNMKL